MFYRTIFVYLVGFLLVKLVEMGKDPKITFEVLVEQKNTLTCDHSHDKIYQNEYTVLEGEIFTVFTKYNSIINHVICHALDNKINFYYKDTLKKNITNFQVKKEMGTLWNCTILTHRDNKIMNPAVHYKDANYTATYCFMKIHVRQTEPPQTILVNYMVVPAVREHWTKKGSDFIAEYQYEDGDTVNVSCANFGAAKSPLTMEYDMAGISSDKSIVKDITSSKMIGFVTKLHSGHNNSYMICSNTETSDYTKVKLRFVMRTKPNIVSIAINGMILRPILKVPENNNYDFECKFAVNQPITVTCEVKQTDVQLVMLDELRKDKKSEVKFYLKPGDNITLPCGADYVVGGLAELVYIRLTTANFPVDEYPLVHMDLPSSGTVMELYSYGEYKLTVKLYEFQHDETLQLKCGPLGFRSGAAPVLYLQLIKLCQPIGCTVSTKLEHLTRENVYPPIVCYLKEQAIPEKIAPASDKVMKEVRVLLRSTVTTSSTTTTTTTSTSTPSTEVMTREKTLPAATATDHNTSSLETITEPAQHNDEPFNLSKLPMIAGIVACIIICVIVIIIIVRFRKRKHSQGGPLIRNYENLAEPSEASIPAHPPQWENNYAEPVDGRIDDATYSEPCQPELYATPVPKHLRNKKQKPLDPTYAVLTVPKGRAKKNAFKESDDPNYSEVYANSQAGYAKVLPKSMRNQAEQDNPYSYVTNERPYVNTDEPEPMYCEPGKAQGAAYANLNNSHYANSNAQEYVEPTYCEPQKRTK